MEFVYIKIYRVRTVVHIGRVTQ